METRARIDGVEIAYEVIGDGPRLVWCHGLASCRDEDRELLDVLAQRFEVLAYDARGHGSSGCVTDAAAYGYPRLADDLCGLLDHVGWERAVLAGVSMGAATCLRVAASHPARAAALVIVRPGAIGEGERAPAWLQMLFAAGAAAIRTGGFEAGIRFLLEIPLARAHFEAHPESLESFRRSWARHDPASLAAALEGIPPTSPMTGGLTGDLVRCPTLVVPGSDPIHPFEAAQAIAAAIPGATLSPSVNGLGTHDERLAFAELLAAFVGRAEARA